MRRTILLLCLVVYLFCFVSNTANAQDVITVNTFEEEHVFFGSQNKRNVSATFNFPDESVDISDIIMNFTIGCPTGGCDDWDRYGDIDIIVPTGVMDSTVASIDTVETPNGIAIDTTWNEPFEVTEAFELFRFITPYGGSFSDSWSWDFSLDVSDYRPYLMGETTLRIFIDTWVEPGWDISISFDMTEGLPERIPYKIVNLWNHTILNYGDANNPAENYLQPISLTVDEEATAAKVRLMNTGHGFGYTDNAAEFSPKTHHLLVEGIGTQTFDQYLWRDDCELNPLSPQAGTWQFDRAGWCPGDMVAPWDYDITYLISPNAALILDYNLQDFVNLCTPTNPDCNSAVDCAGGTCAGGGSPYYRIASQLVYYRTTPAAALDAQVVNLNNLPAISCENVFTPEVYIRNNGSDVLSSAMIFYQLDDEGYQIYNWTGSLAYAQSEAISLPEIILYDAEQHSFEVLVSSPNGGTDANLANDFVNANFTYGNALVTLTLHTDTYGSETSFDITNPDGDVVYASAGFSSVTSYINDICLPNGCYTLNMRDNYGDGMFASGSGGIDGDYTLVDADGNTLASLSNTNFGFVESTEFCVEAALPSPVSVNETTGNQLNSATIIIYPNPAQDVVRIDNINEATMLTLYGVNGHVLQQQPVASNTTTLDISELPKGIYMLHIAGLTNEYTKKLVKQ